MFVPEEVAALALSTFEKLPSRCRPRVQADGRREWTPMSAIVLVIDHDGSTLLNCVSLGTGTKCLPASQIIKCDGLVLHDCHAEVLALRGLNRWLLQETKLMLQSSSYRSDYLELCEHNQRYENGEHDGRPFRLRECVSIYMFSTTAPCGDASMELLMSSSSDPTPWSADSLACDLSTGQPLGRGHFSLLGAVRRKPARGDAEATMSKSCTDKMALKQFTGLLAFPTDTVLQTDHTVYLKGLVVYEDQYNKIGYDRAFGRNGRLKAITDVEGSFFNVHILPDDFPRFPFERSTAEKTKVTNICAVYVAGSYGIPPTQEVLVNGVKQGYKQFEDRSGKGSVLCRRKMLELAMDIQSLLKERELVVYDLYGGKYSDIKETKSRGQGSMLKSHVVEKLGGWVTNSANDDFEVCVRAA